MAFTVRATTMSEQKNEELQMMIYFVCSLLLFSGFIFSYILAWTITGHIIFFTSLCAFIVAVNYIFAKKFVNQQQSKTIVCDKSQDLPVVEATVVEMETGDKLFANKTEQDVVEAVIETTQAQSTPESQDAQSEQTPK